MISQSEKTFGAKLAHAQELLDAISGFSNYAPPHAGQTVAGFTTLLQNIANVNSAETVHEAEYRQAVATRQNAFRENPNSVLKILPSIRAAVLVQFGKSSAQFKEIQAIIKKMRDARVARSLNLQQNPAGEPSAEEDAYRVSQSERSYGSMAENFQNIIDYLGQMPSYNPSNADLQKDALQDFADSLRDFSKNVNEARHQLGLKRRERLDLYDQLSTTVQTIKEYIKAQYGPASSEYTLVKNISV